MNGKTAANDIRSLGILMTILTQNVCKRKLSTFAVGFPISIVMPISDTHDSFGT